MKEKKPEVVLITGASAGVGRATVQRFAREGAHIGLIARGEERLEHARAEVEALGGKALALPTDVADSEALERAAEKVEEAFGPIDIWINNAMESVFSPVKEMTAAEFKRVTEVTYLGYVYGTLAALHRMLPRDHGTIVLVGSALAYRGIPLQAAYCGSKHAIKGFMESLRCELLHDKSQVHVTMVQLPAVNTPQFDWVKSRLPNKPQPVPPIFQPEVIANGIYWAAHERKRELFIGWPTVTAVWANRFVPSLVDRYLAKTGYSSQQTAEPVSPDRKNNLYRPAPGDFGAHGDFDDRAKDRSFELWMATHKGLVSSALAVATIGVMSWLMKRKTNGTPLRHNGGIRRA